MNLIRLLSFGGGQQSHALAVLIAQGQVQVDYVVFANVGEKSENPDTLEYIENYTKPYLAEAGIRFVEVRKVNRQGQPVDLYDAAMRNDRTIPLPVVMPSGAFGNRQCTSHWKIEQVDKFAKSTGATHWITSLGISWEEMRRMRSERWERVNKDSARWHKRVAYPLIDLRLTRGGVPEDYPASRVTLTSSFKLLLLSFPTSQYLD